jgi:hypothetical protein
MDPATLASLLQPLVEDELRTEAHGELVVSCLRPFLPYVLTRVIANLQLEIGTILDLRSVVLGAFVRDKGVLVELFQKVIYILIQSSPVSHRPFFVLPPFGGCMWEWLAVTSPPRLNIMHIHIPTTCFHFDRLVGWSWISS